MTIAARIRAWLAQAPNSSTRQIVEGCGLTGKDAETARQTLSTLLRAGMISQDKSTWPYRYSLEREAVPYEERQARFTAGRDRAIQKRSQSAQERRRADREARAALAEQRAAERQKKALQRAAAQARIRQVANAAIASTWELKAAPKVEQIVGTPEELMAEFLANGGQIERLPQHAVSPANRFKVIGRMG